MFLFILLFEQKTKCLFFCSVLKSSAQFETNIYLQQRDPNELTTERKTKFQFYSLLIYFQGEPLIFIVLNVKWDLKTQTKTMPEWNCVLYMNCTALCQEFDVISVRYRGISDSIVWKTDVSVGLAILQLFSLLHECLHGPGTRKWYISNAEFNCCFFFVVIHWMNEKKRRMTITFLFFFSPTLTAVSIAIVCAVISYKIDTYINDYWWIFIEMQWKVEECLVQMPFNYSFDVYFAFFVSSGFGYLVDEHLTLIDNMWLSCCSVHYLQSLSERY